MPMEAGPTRDDTGTAGARPAAVLVGTRRCLVTALRRSAEEGGGANDDARVAAERVVTAPFDVSTAPSLHPGGLRSFDSVDSFAPSGDDVSEHTILVAEEDVNCRL